MTHDPGSPLAPITPSMEGLGPGPPDATRTSARSPPRQTFTRGQWDLVISFCPPPRGGADWLFVVFDVAGQPVPRRVQPLHPLLARGPSP